MSFLEEYPFVSVIYNKKEEISTSVVINLISKQHISYFRINKLKSNDFNGFFNMVINWWKREPEIPLSLYYKDQIKKYNYALEYLENKDYEVISGFPGTNLKNLSEKRIKRKVITIE